MRLTLFALCCAIVIAVLGAWTHFARGQQAQLSFNEFVAVQQYAPLEPTDDPAEALAKICRSEDGCYSTRDCIAHYQVAKTIRKTKESRLAVFRRLSPSATGTIGAYNDRQRMIQGMFRGILHEPQGWYDNYGWDMPYGKECWEDTLRTADAILKGRRPDVIRGVEPIAWGCEPFSGLPNAHRCWNDVAAACARNLARIPNTATRNTFWCRAGSEGCAPARAPECDYLEIGNAPDFRW